MEKREVLQNKMPKIVVLDDDPTGIQTIYGVSVYTDWSVESIDSGFREKEQMFFILTNSRSFSEEETLRVHSTIASRLARVSQQRGQDFLVVCRGDSTLRGHYLLEPETIAQELEKSMGWTVDGEIYCPCFFECGRMTVGNIHYLKEGNNRVPVSETEFAKDKTFGYKNAHLGRYIEEKTHGRCKAGECLYLPAANADGKVDWELTRLLLHQAEKRRKIVINAASYEELDQFCKVLLTELQCGKHFVIRSAASFVKSIGGFKEQALLNGDNLKMPGNRNGGLILVGSYVEKTTVQLENLKKSGLPFHYIEFEVANAITGKDLRKEVEHVRSEAEKRLECGENVVIYTSRNVVVCNTLAPEQMLQFSVEISKALVDIIREIQISPSFLIAKGGITSSDTGTRALGVKRARVMGQALPGVPVWLTGRESRFPGLPFIIFPGNVGDENSLRVLAEKIFTVVEKE